MTYLNFLTVKRGKCGKYKWYRRNTMFWRKVQWTWCEVTSSYASLKYEVKSNHLRGQLRMLQCCLDESAKRTDVTTPACHIRFENFASCILLRKRNIHFLKKPATNILLVCFPTIKAQQSKARLKFSGSVQIVYYRTIKDYNDAISCF